MRRAVALLVVLLPATLLADSKPKLGPDIPGPFTVYNVTGKHKTRYHCQVSEHGLNPVVMIVVRGVEMRQAGLKSLLKKLDNAVDKNPNTRLASFAVFLSNTLKNVAKDDNERDRLETKVDDIAKDAGLKHVVLCLDALKLQGKQPVLGRWKFEADADVTVVLYKNCRLVAVHKLSWDQLAEKDALPAKVKEILNQVREKFGATR